MSFPRRIDLYGPTVAGSFLIFYSGVLLHLFGSDYLLFGAGTPVRIVLGDEVCAVGRGLSGGCGGRCLVARVRVRCSAVCEYGVLAWYILTL